jgi:hypothetical protein
MDLNHEVKAQEDSGEREAPRCTAPQTDPPDPKRRRLLIRDEVLEVLQLFEDQVQQLINTRQLVPIRIAGEERFDSRELERLIDTYMATALRRADQ